MGPISIALKKWGYFTPSEEGAITLFIAGRVSSSTTVNPLGSWKKWISKIFYGTLFQGGFIVAMNKPQVETITHQIRIQKTCGTTIQFLG